jgi:hypothetical protein
MEVLSKPANRNGMPLLPLLALGTLQALFRVQFFNNNKFLGIIHRPVFYLKHDVSDTGFCLRLQVGLVCLLAPATSTRFVKPT